MVENKQRIRKKREPGEDNSEAQHISDEIIIQKELRHKPHLQAKYKPEEFILLWRNQLSS